MTTHNLKASIGIEGSSTTAGDLRKDDANDIANLANTRVPKYTASILFFEVIAYILGRNHISRLSGTGKRGVPQCDEDIGRNREKRD